MLTSRVEYGLVSENVCEHTTRYDSVLFGNRRTPTAMDWSLGSFGDVRLDRVGASILERMTLRKTVCLRRLGGDRGGELRFGRFFSNDGAASPRLGPGEEGQGLRRPRARDDRGRCADRSLPGPGRWRGLDTGWRGRDRSP